MVYQKGLLERYKKVPYAPGKSVADKASKALNIASKIARQLNVEKKYVDTFWSSTYSAAAPSLQLLNGVEQGDGGQQRNGDQVKFVSLQWRGRVENHASDYNITSRVIIFRDKQHQPGVTLSATGLQAALLDDLSVFSFNNMDNKMRFEILSDKLMTVGRDVSSTVASMDRKNFRAYKKLGKNGLKVRYDGTTATAADIASNPIYAFVYCDSGGTLDSAINVRFRMRFVDN